MDLIVSVPEFTYFIYFGRFYAIFTKAMLYEALCLPSNTRKPFCNVVYSKVKDCAPMGSHYEKTSIQIY